MTSSPVQRPFSVLPHAQGMYDPAFEKDACGLAMVATLHEPPSHRVVSLALEALRNLEHRGATGADEGTGDGAGINTQVPDAFLRAVAPFELPQAGHYAVGIAFLPVDTDARAVAKRGIEELAADEQLDVLGWREVPIEPASIGTSARAAMPAFEQLFVTSVKGGRAAASGIALDRQTFRLRKRAERELDVYFPSLSSRTIVYKGMVTTLQLEPFYPDLSDERFASQLAIVHSRYSTNTFPSWPLAQPMRFIAHNGEINTVQGNRNWMRARQSQLYSEVLGDLRPLFPIVSPGASDSAAFDEVVELLTLAGRSLPHAITMMIPEAYQSQAGIDPARRDYYEYHSMLMEPWDGPAAMVFTDGTLVGATLDRNGLRPGRFVVTDDGLVVLASEIGVLELDPATIVRKGRLQPGKLFLVDVEAGRIIEDDEIKDQLAAQKPWGVWLNSHRINLESLPDREHISHTPASVSRRQRTFGYTNEEVRILIGPMAQHAIEPIGAMGSDTPIAVLSQRPRLLFDYFTQQFAQVTNPPLDSIREDMVTSMSLGIGPERNLLDATPEHAAQVVLDFPVLNNDELAKIQHLDPAPANPPKDGVSTDGISKGGTATTTIRGLYRTADGVDSLPRRLAAMCAEVDEAIDNGAQFIVLSDRDSNAEFAPIPSLLMVSAVHHHLIRTENRLKVGLIAEAGDVREVHHVALLIGYGASGVNPYLAMETAEQLVRNHEISGVDEAEAVRNIIKALGKGVLKIMSKMGISVASSYSGAQAFEAVGLDKSFVDAYFTGTPSRLGGIGLETIAAENLARHRSAYPDEAAVYAHRRLETGGEYQWRREGPPHLFNPETVFRLQHSTRTRRYDIFREYTKLVDDQSSELMTLRGMFTLGKGEREPVPIDEVEPVSEIVKRFSTGAMSLGSISPEAHETLAVAMNRLGARSNTGEGGEDVARLLDPERRSAIKQVASARFGVTSMYLTHARDVQIKMAQGAKPGEGGQLPPTKVYPWIARTRHSTAGVGLISPPPHHDIYSIEDLKQLIFDVKRASPEARVHVKLVSASGIGAVAAGVTKALADVILVSGHDGGTGASPLNSLKHAGTPWEIGLAETQQTLLINGLRDRVVVQVDGQLKTGRDVIVAALLGAEEYGFATAPLVVSGCIMMRVCHLDTCPVGVATQNPELRARFTGKPEFVETFFEFLAEEVREYLAALGFRTLDEAIGHSELLGVDDAVRHWKTEGLDLTPVLSAPPVAGGEALRNTHGQDHKLDEHFDMTLIALSTDALESPTPESAGPVVIDLPIRNTDRAVGTMLGHEVTKRFGELGLPRETIDVTLRGTAGQSLGAFLPAGIILRLEGDANDYVGKGLSGGDIVVRPDPRSPAVAERNIIAGNVIGYGATSGSLFIRGAVGERFMVRNSGAEAVVEGVGDHALEYMTGGVVTILGSTGRNLGAGMSGGVAYVRRLRPDRVNQHALDSGELTLLTLDDTDQAVLRRLLSTHAEVTGSSVARALLDDFASVTDEFVKIMPRDFAAVMQARSDAELHGVDTDGEAFWEQIMEVTGG